MTTENLRGHVTHALSRVVSCTAMGVAFLAPTLLFADAPINDFIIGAYKPAGWINHDEGVPGADAYFTSSDVDMLSAVGINLVIWTTELEDFAPDEAPTSGQDDEEAIASLFGGPGDTGGGLAVYWAAEGDTLMDHPTGRILLAFSGAYTSPLGWTNRQRLGEQADSLCTKWSRPEYEDGFWGYFVGHEADPDWDGNPYTHGIYDSLTYVNLKTVIDSIRKYDPDRRIYVTGDAGNHSTWTIQEQNAFINTFFRPYSESPANVFANERYILWCSSTVEDGPDSSVQARLDALVPSLDRSRNMVMAARDSLSPRREAEWFHTINVNDEYWNDATDDCWSTGERPHYRKPSRAEIKVQAYMALARGATGIMYFAYTSNAEPVDFSGGAEAWYHGIVRFMTDGDPRPKYAMADTLASINDTLAVIGDTLKAAVLRDSSAFRGNFTASSIPTECLIEDITNGSGGDAGRVEIGLFRDAKEALADYILIVNRDNILTGVTPQTIDIILDVSRLEGAPADQGVYSIRNAVTGESLIYEVSNGEILIDDLTMMPGDGVLLRVTSGWSGSIIEDVTWSGTVDVVGDVTVPAGKTLTVTEGTVVEFAATSDAQKAGFDTTACELVVYGTLEAEGVTFSSAESGSHWGCIAIIGDGNPATTDSYIRDCTIEDAQYGTLIQASNWSLGGVSLDDENHYISCTYGVLVQDVGGPYAAHDDTLRNLNIESCNWGIALLGADDTTIEQVLVHGLPGDVCVHVDSSTGVEVTNVTMADTNIVPGDGAGVLFEGGSSGVVKNTLASNLSGGGVLTDGTGSVEVQYYLGFKTDGQGLELSGIDTADVKAFWSDPRLTSEFKLQADSPALDLGDPDDPNDPTNESRRDLGRYGGTSEAGVASGDLEAERYFCDGEGQPGWNKSAGTSGVWWLNSSHGVYTVTGAQGISRADTAIDASSYTIETRMKFTGSEGHLIYAEAHNHGNWRFDLSTTGVARLFTLANTYEVSLSVSPNTWYSVRLEVGNDEVTSYVNGVLCHDGISLGGLSPDGHIGIGAYGSSHSAEFDYVIVLNGAGEGHEGTYLFFDDFNDGHPDGWSIITQSQNWVIENDRLHLDGTWAEGWMFTGVKFDRPLQVEFDIEFDSAYGGIGNHGGMMLATQPKSRWDNSNSGYTVDWLEASEVYRTIKWTSGSPGSQADEESVVIEDSPYHWKVIADGSKLKLYVDDQPLPSFHDVAYSENLYLGLWGYSNNQEIYFDNVSVRDITPSAGGPDPHALSFEGGTTRQEVAIDPVCATGTQYTVEAWMKPDNDSGYYTIVGQHGGTGDAKGTIDMYQGKVRFLLTTSYGFTQLTSDWDVEADVWTHVAGVYDGSHMKIYINGAIDDSTSKTGNIVSAVGRSTRIGGYAGSAAGSTGWFDGLIDEVRIWSVARTQQEIAENRYHEIGEQTGLIGYWQLNEGQGGSTADSSSYNRNGTLTNYQGSGAPAWTTESCPAGKLVASGQALGLPTETRLGTSFPNPFNPMTAIRYELGKVETVRLEVYDLLGQRVRILVDGEQVPGRYQVRWDGRTDSGQQVASGVYICRLLTSGYTACQKMTLLR